MQYYYFRFSLSHFWNKFNSSKFSHCLKAAQRSISFHLGISREEGRKKKIFRDGKLFFAQNSWQRIFITFFIFTVTPHLLPLFWRNFCLRKKDRKMCFPSSCRKYNKKNNFPCSFFSIYTRVRYQDLTLKSLALSPPPLARLLYLKDKWRISFIERKMEGIATSRK